MNTIARLAALERQKPATEPFTVIVEVLRDGTTVCVCYPLPHAHTDRMTLREYRARFGETYRHRERWYHINGAAPVDNRMAEQRA